MTTGTLAVAVGRLNVLSETFIAADIRDLAPGRTVVLCARSDGLGASTTPTHEFWRGRAPRSWAARRVARLVTLLRTGSFLVLHRRQQEDAEAFCRAHRVGVVLAEYGPTGCGVTGLCRRLGIPLFVYFRGYDVTELLTRSLYRSEYRRLARLADGFITVSRFLAERLVAAGFPGERIHVVPSGVRSEAFPARPWPDGPPRLLAVGRFTEKKAPDLTIAAFARLAGSFPDAVLEMIGDGDLMPRCREEVAACGLQDRVILHGARPPSFVRDRMSASHVFLQHSVTASSGETEGLPVAVVEAMMSGLPVVSTRHAGIPEAVLEGETGLLVEEHDIDGMAAAIDRLLRDLVVAARMGAAGARRARAHFSRAESVARLRGILGLEPGDDPIEAGVGTREEASLDLRTA